MVVKQKYRNTNLCIHCGAENPPTAYCCLSCFKIIKARQNVPFWKMRIQPTLPALAVVFAVFFVVALLLKHWMENIDAQITMDLKTVDYTMSFIADKRKKQQLEIKSSSSVVPPSAEATSAAPPENQ